MAFLDETGLGYFWKVVKTHISSQYQTKHITRTVTLAAGSWSTSKQQTVSVTGVTASNTVIIAPTPESFTDYVSAQIRGVSQASGTITFQCGSTPTSNLTVNITILS